MEFTQDQLAVLKTEMTEPSNDELSVNALRRKVAELSREKELLKETLGRINEELEETLKLLGVGEMFQSEDGTVFKIVKPEGTFVAFKTIDYLRTRKDGEKGGNFLSKKEAEQNGFEVK